MSIARRLFTTTTRRCNVIANPETPAQLSAIDLPPTIYTIIERHIAMSPPSSSYAIPNPFLMHKASSDASSSSSVPQHAPRAISRRREKQLLDHYSGIVLPPSDLNRLSQTPSIRWTNGEEEVTVTWSGEVGEEQNKTLYGSRRRMFKGHKHERERPERERETRERMSGMEKRITDWRSVSCLLPNAIALADHFSHRQMPNHRRALLSRFRTVRAVSGPWRQSQSHDYVYASSEAVHVYHGDPLPRTDLDTLASPFTGCSAGAAHIAKLDRHDLRIPVRCLDRSDQTHREHAKAGMRQCMTAVRAISEKAIGCPWTIISLSVASTVAKSSQHCTCTIAL